MTKLVRLLEGQHELDLCVQDKFNVVHLNLQYFIEVQQAQEQEGISSSQHPANLATTPSVNILSLVLVVVPDRLDIPTFRLVVEIIDLLQDVL